MDPFADILNRVLQGKIKKITLAIQNKRSYNENTDQ